jgi:hypothetical protein
VLQPDGDHRNAEPLAPAALGLKTAVVDEVKGRHFWHGWTLLLN